MNEISAQTKTMYVYGYESQVRGLNGFVEMFNLPDFEERRKRLVAGLSKESVDVVNLVLQRLKVVLNLKEGDVVDLYTKEEQAAFIPGTNDQLFKDFYKMRPTAMSVYHIRESIKEDLNIVDVALIMSYKSGNLTHVVFYRYIENVVQKIIGNYEEL